MKYSLVYHLELRGNQRQLKFIYTLFKEKPFIVETVIFGAVAIAIVIIFSLSTQEFATESLLLAVLIFGIYPIVSGKVKEFGFMDFEIKVRDAKSEPLEKLTEEEEEAQIDASEAQI